MTLLIIGYKRSGKDTAAQFFKDNFGMTFKSSSKAAAEIFIYDELKDKYGYTSIEECFQDRVNRRAEWFNLISAYNQEDKTKLAREIIKYNDCYVGMRSREEIAACREQGLFDLVIWIDAEGRVGKENSDSCLVNQDDADIIVDNNGTEEQFFERLHRIGNQLFK